MTNPPKTTPQDFTMQSPDTTEKNIAELMALFPHCVTETHDENKQPKRVIDFDLLRQTLSSEIVEVGKERYQINWPGKTESLLLANTSIKKTLRPKVEESKDWETTQNLFIEGDNLDALKLLQNTYLGKVKMIYIDPPYNTGNDFIYKDSFKVSADEHKFDSGQADEEGNRLVPNPESKGRFHSDWLSMMYPRLLLAHRFLRDDGVIFISIDDNEQANLKRLCDEVFGEDNFVANTVRVSNSAKNNVNQISVTHEYALVYCKDIDSLSKNWAVPKNQVSEFESYAKRLLKQGLSQDDIEKELKILTKYPRFYEFDHFYYCDNMGVYQTDNPGGVKGGNKESEIYHPITKKLCKKPDGGWRYKEDKIRELERENKWHFGQDETTIPRMKRYLRDCLESKPTGIHFFDSQSDTKMLKASGLPFDFPKPKDYISYLLRMDNTDKDSIILDFFAGSGTTAHAVMELNAKDGGNRKFICVQIPEAIDENSDYKTITEVSKERIRRAGKKILENSCHPDWNKDIGFRVLAVDSTNMKDVYYSPADLTQALLENTIDNFKDNRLHEDLLFQVMLDLGLDLSLPMHSKDIEGRRVFFVNEKNQPTQNPVNVMMACFERLGTINTEFCKTLARQKPARAVFRDGGFKDDCAQTNVVQIFKTISPNTTVKVL